MFKNYFVDRLLFKELFFGNGHVSTILKTISGLVILILIISPINLYGDWNLLVPPGNGLMQKAYINQDNEILSQGMNSYTHYCPEPFGEWRLSVSDDSKAVSKIATSGTMLYGLNHERSGTGTFYISNDWGQTWVHLVTTQITPSYNDVLLFKAYGDTLVIASKDSLYYSTDRGSNWVSWMEGINTYFSAKDLIRTDSHIYVMSGTIHLSDGFGKPFKEMRTGLEQQTLYCLQQSWDRVYALTYNSVFYITDSDSVWTKVSMGNFPYHAAESFYVNQDDIYVLIYKGETGFYHAEEGQTSWNTLDLGLPKYGLKNITGNDQYLVVSADAGVFISADKGYSWNSALNGLPKVNREILDIKKNNESIFFMNVDGIYGTKDHGNTWDYFGGGLTIKAHSVLNVHDTLFAIGSTGSGNFDSNEIFRKVHSDSNWIKPAEIVGGWGERLFSITWYNDKLYVAGSNGIFISDNMGNTWTDLNMDTTTYAYDLTFHNDQLYFYGKRNNGSNTLYVFNNTEQLWEPIESDLNVYYANLLLNLESNHDYIFALTQKALYRFDDTNNTWDSLQVGYNEEEVMTTLLCDGANIILGSSKGGYISRDSGNSWDIIPLDGISENNPRFDFYEISGDTLFLRASELYAGNNAYWGKLQNISSVEQRIELADGFKLAQNYPNPFNPSTTLEYALPEKSDVKLIIYDIKGNTVTEWNYLAQNAGYYSVVWDGYNKDGNKISTGIYLYQITAGKYSQTKKMIFIK
jgi:hypothetical protein